MQYESVLGAVESLRPSRSDGQRDVTWLGAGTTVGVSRTVDDRIEIFLAGAPLQTIYAGLASKLVRGTWHRSGDQPSVEANRLLLPVAGHFTQVAAFICTELLRNGADADLPEAFRRSEALINHSVEGLSMNAGVLIGLKGELVLLDALLQGPGSPDVAQMIGCWHGWRRSTRDFAVGPTGVEVKATTGPSSTHEVQGVHQVQRAAAPDPEDRLLLVSVGIEGATADNPVGLTVPRVVDLILERVRQALTPPEADLVCAEFLVHLKDYGSEHGVGYDHGSMRDDPVFAQPFVLRWVRAYDMQDPAIEVLTSSTLSTFAHVEPGSARYSVQLPEQVNGDINPLNGLAAAASAIFGGAAPGE